MARRRDILVLGASQCVYWGVLYYAFAVFQMPLATAFHCAPAYIAGAYSLGLAVTGLMAPLVGRWLDRGAGVALMRYGPLLAAALLLAWANVHSLPLLYIVWTGLGVAMAMVLYEPAFALVRTSMADDQSRSRAIATVTILGGLASTVFLPLTAALIPPLGWRDTLRLLAVVVLLTSLLVDRFGLRSLAERQAGVFDGPSGEPEAPLTKIGSKLPGGMGWLRAVFFLSTLANMALTVQLVPTLVARGHSGQIAAGVLALMGIMQLPGRIFVMYGRSLPSTTWLLAFPLFLQAVGLAVLAFAAPVPVAAVGVGIFGVGAGLNTVARPLAIQSLYGLVHAGHLNGDLARAQHIARACGPLVISMCYLIGSADLAFGGTAVMLGVLASILSLMPAGTRDAAGLTDDTMARLFGSAGSAGSESLTWSVPVARQCASVAIEQDMPGPLPR